MPDRMLKLNNELIRPNYQALPLPQKNKGSVMRTALYCPDMTDVDATTHIVVHRTSPRYVDTEIII